jgi:hypothetical protein
LTPFLLFYQLRDTTSLAFAVWERAAPLYQPGVADRRARLSFAGVCARYSQPSTQRLLDHIGEGRSSNHSVQVAATRKATAGTLLIREWQGVSHRVTVLDDSVVYQGQRYQSLSEVARLITGSRWSGPLFFGLKNRAKEARYG